MGKVAVTDDCVGVKSGVDLTCKEHSFSATCVAVLEQGHSLLWQSVGHYSCSVWPRLSALFFTDLRNEEPERRQKDFSSRDMCCGLMSCLSVHRPRWSSQLSLGTLLHVNGPG